MTLVLTVDWSHSSTTVTVVDIAARSTVAQGRALHTGSTSQAELTESWWSALLDATHTALDGLAVLNLTTDDIRLLELTTSEPVGGLVTFDRDGAVSAALSSNHSESQADADWLLSQLPDGAEGWLALTGVLPTAGSTIALLSWLHRTSPDAWSSMHTITLPIGFLASRLGGAPALDPRCAIGTATIERETEQWCMSLFELVDATVDWSSVLPPLTSAATPIGMLSVAAAEALGLPAGRPLHAGHTTDH